MADPVTRLRSFLARLLTVHRLKVAGVAASAVMAILAWIHDDPAGADWPTWLLQVDHWLLVALPVATGWIGDVARWARQAPSDD